MWMNYVGRPQRPAAVYTTDREIETVCKWYFEIRYEEMQILPVTREGGGSVAVGPGGMQGHWVNSFSRQILRFARFIVLQKRKHSKH